MRFRQIGRKFQRARAVKFRLLQPDARRIKLKVAAGANQRKSGMRQRETRIARYGGAQMALRLFKQNGITRRTEPVAAHEFRICQRIFAVPQTALAWRGM